MRTFTSFLMGAALLCSAATTQAQSLEFRGVKANARYDDGEPSHNEYLGWDYETGKAKFKVDQGVWKLSVTADTVTS